MTSGNLSDEPICIDNDEAVARLGKLADGFLMHDRDIERSVDDSVVRVMAGREPGSGWTPSAPESTSSRSSLGLMAAARLLLTR